MEAGITIRKLGPALAKHGLALENQGDVDPQTITGAISTATHGTGARFGNLSSQVEGVRLVTANDGVVDVREGDELLAARVGLGALGVISAVTLALRARVQDPSHQRAAPARRRAGPPRPDVDANDHFELFVFPYTRTALTLTSERTDRQPEGGSAFDGIPARGRCSTTPGSSSLAGPAGDSPT